MGNKTDLGYEQWLAEKLDKLRLAVTNKDSEVMHSTYDEIMERVCRRHCPRLAQQLESITEGMPFHCA